MLRVGLACALVAALAVAGCVASDPRPAPVDGGPALRSSVGGGAEGTTWRFGSCDDTFLQVNVLKAQVEPYLPPGYVAYDSGPGLSLAGIVVSTCLDVAMDNGTAPVDVMRQAFLYIHTEGSAGPYYVVAWVVSDAAVRDRLRSMGFEVSEGDLQALVGETQGTAAATIGSEHGPWGLVAWTHETPPGTSSSGTWRLVQHPRDAELAIDVHYDQSIAGSLPQTGCLLVPASADLQAIFTPAPRTGCLTVAVRSTVTTYTFVPPAAA